MPALPELFYDPAHCAICAPQLDRQQFSRCTLHIGRLAGADTGETAPVRQSDEDLAENIREAIRDLNERIEEASRAGLCVELDVLRLRNTTGTELISVSCRVSRTL